MKKILLIMIICINWVKPVLSASVGPIYSPENIFSTTMFKIKNDPGAFIMGPKTFILGPNDESVCITRESGFFTSSTNIRIYSNGIRNSVKIKNGSSDMVFAFGMDEKLYFCKTKSDGKIELDNIEAPNYKTITSQIINTKNVYSVQSMDIAKDGTDWFIVNSNKLLKISPDGQMLWISLAGPNASLIFSPTGNLYTIHNFDHGNKYIAIGIIKNNKEIIIKKLRLNGSPTGVGFCGSILYFINTSSDNHETGAYSTDISQPQNEIPDAINIPGASIYSIEHPWSFAVDSKGNLFFMGIDGTLTIASTSFMERVRLKNFYGEQKNLFEYFPNTRPSVVLGIMGSILVSMTFGMLIILRVTKARRQRRTEQRRQVEENRRLILLQDKVASLRAEPLQRHHFCPSCGWLGYLQGRGPMFTGQKITGTVVAVGGTAAAVGGGGLAALGCGGSLLGIALIIIGIPLLFFFGLGLIPMAIGGILLSVGGTATSAGAAVASAGTSVAVGGGSAVAQAVQSERQAREAAPVCPACRKQGVIPAHAPMAKHYFETVPALAHQAEIVTRQVLAEFPEMTIVEAEAEAE